MVDWFQVVGLAVLTSPAVLLSVLGLTSLIGMPLREQQVGLWTFGSISTGLIAVVIFLIMMLASESREYTIDLGNLVVIPQQHFHFHLKFIFDLLSVPFTLLTYLLCGIIAVFTSRYLHREPGFGRFYLCYAFFTLGIILTALAGTIEVLFFGWELVGLSSALLVAFFHDRPSPVRNGLRVWTVYRLADAAFLIAAVALHHMTGAGDFEGLMGAGPWPHSQAWLTSNQALFVGLLLLFAAAGKSALIPFCGWLPRAMEGPTPSSAIFYGALSVHLGAYLLLRVSPILEISLLLSATVVMVGLSTSFLAAMAARVQTDIKSALAFASLTQVGIIVVEIGLGLRYLALLHIIGHACLRSLQLLRAPTLLHDYHMMENAIGKRLEHQTLSHLNLIPHGCHRWLYRWALERGYLDVVIDTYLIAPLLSFFRRCDTYERRWVRFLAGHAPPNPPEPPDDIGTF